MVDHTAIRENAHDSKLTHLKQIVIKLEAVFKGTLGDLLHQEEKDLQERRSGPQRLQLNLEHQEDGLGRLEAAVERKKEKLLNLQHKAAMRKRMEFHEVNGVFVKRRHRMRDSSSNLPITDRYLAREPKPVCSFHSHGA